MHRAGQRTASPFLLRLNATVQQHRDGPQRRRKRRTAGRAALALRPAWLDSASSHPATWGSQTPRPRESTFTQRRSSARLRCAGATWRLERVRRSCHVSGGGTARRATSPLRAPQWHRWPAASKVNLLDKRADGTTTLVLDVHAAAADRTTPTCGVSDVLAPLSPMSLAGSVTLCCSPSSTATRTHAACSNLHCRVSPSESNDSSTLGARRTRRASRAMTPGCSFGPSETRPAPAAHHVQPPLSLRCQPVLQTRLSGNARITGRAGYGARDRPAPSMRLPCEP
jgi:hypothetical protein